MNHNAFSLTAALLLLLLARASWAVPHPYEFHATSGMLHADLGPVANTRGYVNVATDSTGHGVINVMFANGSQLDGARFNARVKFLNPSGAIVREEIIERRIGPAEADAANERKVSRRLNPTAFDSIQVEFYLSDIPRPGANASTRKGIASFARSGERSAVSRQ